jgi:hypothetical protein
MPATLRAPKALADDGGGPTSALSSGAIVS